MVAALLLALAVQGLEAVDDANLALTSCGFAAFRDADSGDQTLAQFETTLAIRCAGQVAGMRGAIISLKMTRNGQSKAAAGAKAESAIAAFRQQMMSDYAQREERQEELRQLERALRKENGNVP